MLWLMLSVFGFGCVGGVVNAILPPSSGFRLPRRVGDVFDPGWMGNVFIGGIAAFAS